MNQPTVLLTLDGLSWKALQAAIATGQAPGFRAFAGGALAMPLKTIMPPAHPAIWASLAAGVLPEVHGVTYHEEEWAGGLRPAGKSSWLVHPVWSKLEGAGYATATICYPSTRPGAAWDGVHIDERLLDAGGPHWEDWPLSPDLAPEFLREAIRDARVHWSEVPAALLAPFRSAGTSTDATSRALSIALARSSTLFATARMILAERSFDFFALHVDWAESFRKALALGADESMPTPVWALLDNALSSLSSSFPDATFLVVSPGSPGSSGFAIVRPGSAHDVRKSFRISILDVAPTILSLFGIADPELPGTSVFNLDCSPLPGSLPQPPPPADAADLDQVKRFGHSVPTPPPGWPTPKLLAEAELLLERDIDAAEMRATQALALMPDSPFALALVGLIAFARGNDEAVEQAADRFTRIVPNHIWGSMLRAGQHVLRGESSLASPYLLRVEAEGDADDLMRVAGAWLLLNRSDDAARVFRRVLEVQPERVQAILGIASTMKGRPFDAEQLLRRAIAIDPDHASAREALAKILGLLGRSQEAKSLIGT